MITMKKKPQSTPSKTLSKNRIFFGILFICLSFILVVSFISYLSEWKSDQSQAGALLDKDIVAANIFGKIGDWLGNLFIFNSVGIAAFIVAFLFFVLGTIILKKKYFKPWKTLSHSIFFLCWVPIFFGALTGGKGVLSGVYGFQIADYLSVLVGSFGLWLILLISVALYFILEFDLRPSKIKAGFHKINEKVEKVKEILPTSETPEEETSDKNNTLEGDESEEEDVQKEQTSTNEKAPLAENPSPQTQEESAPEIPESLPIPPISLQKTPQPSPEKGENPSVTKENKADDIAFTVEQKPIESEANPEDKAQQLVQKNGIYDHKLDLAKFQLPPISLLKDYGNQSINIDQQELEENKNRIVGLLKNFNVDIKEIKATIGPTVTLYEIIPAAGIRVAKIKKLQDDIALNLSALGIRIIAPMPGKGTIGIEVPNKKPKLVSMRSVIASPKFQNAKMALPIAFGKTISNDVFVADLAKMPHLLMAGATGQGKSVGLNAIITSLLYKRHPSELKFVMVDPKKVELSLYSKIERHYLAKLPGDEDAIITDNSKVIDTLNSLCIEMDERYELLKEAFCKNIREYNHKFINRKLNPENGHRFLPYIVLIVDEFADLIMTAGKEVEQPVARLAQLARAIGIHLIIATQRPSVNVITGMIKANFPARAAFRVISGVDSRTILDSPGAEQLVGKGDMLYFNGNDLIRLQCAFVDTPEVEEIAEFIGGQKGYASAYELPEPETSGESSGGGDLDEKDSLFDEAARIIVSTQQGSASMLQRQLKIGYNRAGRIIDQMEVAGIVGSFNGSKAREVMIKDPNALEQYLKEL